MLKFSRIRTDLDKLPGTFMLLAPLGQSSAFDVDTVLSPYVYVFIVAYLISFIFTPIMRRVAEYYGVIDKPDLMRKMHSRPVAYLGGVAVFMDSLSPSGNSNGARRSAFGGPTSEPPYYINAPFVAWVEPASGPVQPDDTILLFNLKTNGDYLALRANPLENNLVLWKFENGRRSQVKWIRNTPTPTRTWHDLKVLIVGEGADRPVGRPSTSCTRPISWAARLAPCWRSGARQAVPSPSTRRSW